MSEFGTKGLDEKYCSECAAIIKVKAEICPKCGVRQFNQPAFINLGPLAANGKSRIATALFAFLLGSFGIHRFYLGHIWLGFLYLVFCWTGIPTVVSLVEFVLLLLMSDQEFDQRYGQMSV